MRQGFLYMVQTIGGIKDSLTLKTPDDDGKILLALVISVSALSVTSVIVGLVGSMQVRTQFPRRYARVSARRHTKYENASAGPALFCELVYACLR